MKTKLSPSIVAALYSVELIADKLAVTCTCSFSDKLADAGMDVSGVLNNLDEVAAAVTLADLADAPAKLNAAARAFRQTFPCDSLGWEDAGRLQTIASDIAAHLAATAA